MSKIKSILNSIILSFMFMGVVGTGLLSFALSQNTVTHQSDAVVLQTETISNTLPYFWDYGSGSEGSLNLSEGAWSTSDNATFLLDNTDAGVTLQFGLDEVEATYTPAGGATQNGTNWAYLPDASNTQSFSYLDFQPSISLYYNKTNTEVQTYYTNSQNDENLLRGADIESFAKPYHDDTDNDGQIDENEQNGVPVPSNPSVIPQQFLMTLKINSTQLENILISDGTVTLKNGGLYTLAIPVVSYVTENGGQNFSTRTETFYYTFAIFESSQYFSSTSFIPNAQTQAMQVSATNSTSSYSRVYFSNYSYQQADSIDMPSFSYNPRQYQLTVTYTNYQDVQTRATILFDYDTNEISFVDATGSAISNEDIFLFASYNESGNIDLYFNDIGFYDITFDFVYNFTSSLADGQNQVSHLISLDLPNIGSQSPYNTKPQRVALYGYQIFYTDLSDIDETTGSTTQKELKTIQGNSILESADITSRVNRNQGSDDTNPSQQTAYSMQELFNMATTAISNHGIEPLRTNQTPVSFRSNVNLQNIRENDSNHYQSMIFRQGSNGDFTPVDGGGQFQGFNQSENGTYLYIIQYKFDNFLSPTGAGQSSYYHYQMFYFTVASETPTVSVLRDSDCQEVYTQNYTNQGVYLIDNSSLNPYDADVTISLTATNFSGQQVLNIENISLLASNNPYASQGITYYDGTLTLPPSIQDGEEYIVENAVGLHIARDSAFANCKFVISIRNRPNSQNASTRSFTIDTTEIGTITARNVTATSGTNYLIDSTVSITGRKTNQPIVLSWQRKASGAPTYGYYQYIPLTQTNFYPSTGLSSLLREFVQDLATLPTNAVVNLSSYKDTSNWEQYTNSLDFNNSVDASYVLSSPGFYFVEVYDEAGNASFEIYFIDNTSPIFVLNTQESGLSSRTLLSSSTTIAVSESYTITLEWGENKAIYLNGLQSILNSIGTGSLSGILGTYSQDRLSDEEKAKWPEKFQEFFADSGQVQRLQVTSSATPPSASGIESYTGDYLIIPLEDDIYVKDDDSSSYSNEIVASGSTSHLIPFFKEENGQTVAREGTWKFLLRDQSNTRGVANEYGYTTYPSAIATINITSDSSRLGVITDQSEPNSLIDSAGFSFIGSFYEDSNGNLSKVQNDEYTSVSNKTFRYAYYSPTSLSPLYLYYIPLAEDGSTVQSVTMYYYPYVKESRQIIMYDGNGNPYGATAYYYTISDTPNITPIFTYNDSTEYTPNEGQTYDLASVANGTINPGKYVFIRQYRTDSTVATYDYFERDLTLYVDRYNVISDQESVTGGQFYTHTNSDGSATVYEVYNLTTDGQTITLYKKINSTDDVYYILQNGQMVSYDLAEGAQPERESAGVGLESIIGGDMLLQMYQGDGNSSISVSFPNYSIDNGLNSGSFASSTSGGIVYSVTTNKLPVSLNIPEYKYTYNFTYSSKDNSYSVDINNSLSSYGDLSIVEDGGRYRVETAEGIVVGSYDTFEQAQQILTNSAIEEYKLYAEVHFTSGSQEQWYKTGDLTSDGRYLLFFAVDSQTDDLPEDISASNAVSFWQSGVYEVTIYQGSQNESFRRSYTFSFRIESSAPAFDIITEQGVVLDTTEEGSIQTAYTNSPSVTFRWYDSESDYIANIDKANIQITTFNGTQTNTFTYSGTIDTSGLENSFSYALEGTDLWRNGAYIQVRMQYEGYNENYYETTTKRVYVDYSAPLDNLGSLMNNVTTSTNFFNRLYQEANMRNLYDYNNEIIDTSSWTSDNILTMLANVSYSYSKAEGIFDKYAYNVGTDYIATLRTLSAQAQNTGSKYIYINNEAISYDDLEGYVQVTRNSFAPAAYTLVENFDETEIIANEYREIVEMDMAGNMTVYLVHFTVNNENETAISYTNSQLDNAEVITNAEIQDGFNIYSNSRMELQTLNFQSDPWGFYLVTINGTRYYYMTSPLLEDNQIYLLSNNSGVLNAQVVELSQIFADVPSSTTKHTMLLANRESGQSTRIYLSIMDATLPTYKIQDSATPNTAIFEIGVPSASEIASTTTATIFPVDITIAQFSDTGNIYNQIFHQSNPSGNPSLWTSSVPGVTISYNASTGRLRFAVNFGALASGKLRYTIVDNFGHSTIVVQIQNEESCEEVVSPSGTAIYQTTESDDMLSTTYLSADTLRFQYNELLYNVVVEEFKSDTLKFEKVENPSWSRLSGTTTIQYLDVASDESNYDIVYRFTVYELEENLMATNSEPVRTVIVRVYDRLPNVIGSSAEASDANDIWFLDRYNEYIDGFGENELSVEFDGQILTTSHATYLTTYSNIVTLRFDNGQQQTADGEYSYLDQYPYSVYISSDNGQNWLNVNSYASAGYAIRGVGEYIILVKYDTNEVLTDQFKLLHLTILNSSSTYYFITVDGLRVEANDITYTDSTGRQYDTNYIISVDYNDKDSRVVIERNKELGVVINNGNSNEDVIEPIRTEQTGTNVVVEIYHYTCDQSEGYFTIIYIEETTTILDRLDYTATGANQSQSLLGGSSAPIVVSTDQNGASSAYMRLSWTGYYGIEENQITVVISKLFNGQYVPINLQVHRNGNLNYVDIDRAGSYQLQFIDSCSPANVHNFGASQYLSIIFLNTVPFHVTYTDALSQEQITVEPTDRAVYNGDVTLSLVDLSTYYNPSGYPSIHVTRNGNEYTNFTQNSYSYTFSEPGYYRVTFSATDRANSIAIREQVYTFTIINNRESTLSYQVSPYGNYYIESVLKYTSDKANAVDITEDLKSLLSSNLITVDGENYLNELLLSYYDERTGGGHYIITMKTGISDYLTKDETSYPQVTSDTFTFEVWINTALPPISVSVAENTSTTSPITISFNTQNLYNAVGDSYLIVGNQRYDFNEETLADYPANATITISNSGTYYIQLFTESGTLLYSYRVVKTDPLNAWAIIAIVLGVLAAVAIVLITLKLRKRMKVK